MTERPIAQRDLLSRLLPQLVVPIVLGFLIWSAAGFPIRGEALTRAAVLFLLLYAPGKGLKILIHKKTGLLRENALMVSISAAAVIAIWAFAAGVAFLEYGLFAIPSAVVAGYGLWLIWAAIRGEDVSWG